jgi:hypothetical protein
MGERVHKQRKLFLVWVRNGGACAVCGRRVDPADMATDRAVSGIPQMGELRRVRLLHPGCRSRMSRQSSYPEAA